MNRTFFTESEDLYAILSNNLQNLNKNIKKISTGWTNIVLDVQSNGENYIIKLPRDPFWSKYIVKDAEGSNFVRNNLGIMTAEMQIMYDADRPFSIHRKIDGNTLTDRLNILSNEKIAQISKKLAEIFYLFHTFSLTKLPNSLRCRYYDFISKLPKLDENNYDFSYFDGLLSDEKSEEQVFIHGDLNIGNIILDNDDNLKAIIDYSFCGIGDIYTDLSTLACRIDDNFFENIIFEYQKISKKILDRKKMNDRKNLRKYIESEYIKYMKVNHPEIVF